MKRITKSSAAAAGVAGAGAVGYKLVSRWRKRGDEGEAVGSYHELPVSRPAPPDAPGPSVPAPGPSAAERADAVASPGNPLDDPADRPDLVAREEAAAALEAGAIGGPHLHEGHGDPAMDAVYEAGGGEAEGFEEAERALIENASHGGGRGRPTSDAFDPEVESDRAGAEYGEADDAESER